MKPADHPEFFRLPPPPGRSRESSIVLDAEGRFFHDGERVAHPGMARAFASWIRRHPDDGRFILNNDYDWTYFRVEDVPFFVERLVRAGTTGSLNLELSDGTSEPFVPERCFLGENGVLYADVKQGAFQARFTRSAQLDVAPLLTEGENGTIFFDLGGDRVPIRMPQRKA